MLVFSGMEKIINLAIYFSQYLNMLFYQNIKNIKISLTSSTEIIIDSYFFNLLDIVIVFFKKTDLRFNKISDIVVYDRPSYELRYLISYIFSNSDRELKIRLRFATNATNTIIMSISEILRSASWAEREAMDMFGLKFLGHRDLRRIIGDYGLWGFPGRKDFPLVGIYSYFYVVNFLRVFRVRGMLNDFWSIYFQKKIYTQC